MCLEANQCMPNVNEVFLIIELVMLVLMALRLLYCDVLLVDAVRTISKASEEFSDLPNTTTFTLHFALTSIVLITFLA